MDFNSGRSVSSLFPSAITVKHKSGAAPKGLSPQLNGNQLRQVCSSRPLHTIHSQTPRENSSRRQHRQTEEISVWASLFIISSIQSDSSIPVWKCTGSCCSVPAVLPFQSLPTLVILNLTHRVVSEGIAADLQPLQSLTIL